MPIKKGIKIGKRILSLVLVLCMALTLLPTWAAAEGVTLQFDADYTGGVRDKETGQLIYFTTNLKILYTEGDSTATVYFTRVPTTEGDSELIEKYNALPAEGVAVYSVKVLYDEPMSQYMLSEPQWQGAEYIDAVFSDGETSTPGSIWLPSAKSDDFLIVSFHGAIHFDGTRTELSEEKYIFGEDSFFFANTTSSFFTADDAVNGIVYNNDKLSKKYYEMLISGCESSEIAAINTYLSKAFNGYCFGMVATSTLFYSGGLKLSQVDGSAQNAYALGKPVANTALRDAIIYYHLVQNINAVTYRQEYLKNSGTNIAKLLVSDLKASLPVPVPLAIGKLGVGGHALLAYDLKEVGSGYEIMVYDPKYPKEPITMTISSDYSSYSFSGSGKQYDSYDLLYTFPKSSGLFNENQFTAALAPIKMPELPEGSAVLTANTGTLTVESGDQKAVFEDGKKVSGELDVTCLGYVNEVGEETEVMFFINPPTERTEPWYVTIYSGPGTRLSYQQKESNKNDGVFIQIDCTGTSEMYIEPITNIAKVKSSGGRFKVSIASDKTAGELFGTTVETSGTEISITPTTSGAVVESDVQADITVSGATEYVSFENVECGSGITVENSGETSALKDTSGNTVATGDASDSGGTATEGKKTNITSVSFSDVSEDSWYAESVRAVAEAGIINGKGNGVFAPDDNVTLAEAVKLAAAVHAKLTGSNYDFSGGDPWYQPYLDYLDQTESFPDLTGYNFNAPANRELFANVMAGVLSAMSERERARNNIADDAIPDVPSSDVSIGIYSLYRAGIVIGSDAQGTYNPYSNIKRSEVAAIIHRFIDAGQRKSITLTVGGAQETPAASTNDGDVTSYIPDGWSWSADSAQGYGLNTFTFGKYVRSDGSAVLYICGTDNPLCFKYYVFAMPDGAKSSAYTSVSTGTLSSSTQAENTAEAINFTADGEHITVSTNWSAEKYISYGAPDGQYTLVRGLN